MNRRWVGPVVVAAMLVFAAVVYPSLPERIPSHWNIHGQVDGWMGRWSAFLMPLMAAGIWGLLLGLRKVDPRRAHYERFDETFWLVVNLVVLFLAVMQVAMLGVALGWPVDVDRVVTVAMGLLFIALGNYLPRVRSNWWMGVRTPWTLESETVWRETHRVAGWSFVAGGLVVMLLVFLPSELRVWCMMAALILAGLTPVVYSYVAWRRERREGNTHAGP